MFFNRWQQFTVIKAHFFKHIALLATSLEIFQNILITMKNAVVILITLFTIFSCNQDKKTIYIPLEKKVDMKSAEENIYEVPTVDTLSYSERGLKYALSTQAVLGKNLMETIQKSGTAGALSFCDEKASLLTDSMSIVHNARLKRVSDKPRNQDNQANARELEHIKTFKEVIANQEVTFPIVTDSETSVQIYYPIMTNAMCLQCHGQPNKNIEPSTLKKLAQLFPDDQANGYGLNEVIGIWTVIFDK